MEASREGAPGVRLAARIKGLAGSEIRERMKDLAKREIIHLGGGLPDPAFFPVEPIARACAAIFADPTAARTALQYAPSEGHPPLREWLAGYMASLGVPCTPANILITNGSQQGLDLIAKLLIDPGAPVMIELPSFIGALRAFDVMEPRYVGLSADLTATGIRERPRFAYLGPDFRNPTGTSLTLAERHALLDLSDALAMPLVEDGCYEKLRYDGEDLPSLLALDCARKGGIEQSRLLYTGTFSKTLAPSLRVGWIAAASPLIARLVLLKQAADLATSALNQMIALALADGILDSAVAQVRGVYRGRRDAMLAALADHMPAGVQWTEPEGGLYIWLTLPEGMDGGELARRALIEHGVATISGAAFYPIEARPNTLRLSFSMVPEEAAREAVRRLGLLVEDMMGVPAHG
jgi:DNA-binding transcriptional MocR family regulator